MHNQSVVTQSGSKDRDEQEEQSAQEIRRFAKDVSQGRIQDVASLLWARRGPVLLAEINALNAEIHKLDYPFLPASHMIRNPDTVRTEIAAFGQKRRILAEYRQILHEIRQLQHRETALERSKQQILSLKQTKKTLRKDDARDLAERIAFWTEAARRDRVALDQIETRLKALSPLTLNQIRASLKSA